MLPHLQWSPDTHRLFPAVVRAAIRTFYLFNVHLAAAKRRVPFLTPWLSKRVLVYLSAG